jgi:hypothetical protein
MPHASCAHCGVAITDHATMVERADKTFCCNNCAAFATGQTGQTAMGTCAHCHTPIVDPSTRVERGGEMFCCTNCAAAMPARAGQQRH